MAGGRWLRCGLCNGRTLREGGSCGDGAEFLCWWEEEAEEEETPGGAVLRFAAALRFGGMGSCKGADVEVSEKGDAVSL